MDDHCTSRSRSRGRADTAFNPLSAICQCTSDLGRTITIYRKRRRLVLAKLEDISTCPPYKCPPATSNFRIIDRMLNHPELCLRLATVMDPKDLVTLYSISKPFHWIINSHFTTYVRSAANHHAPNSSWIFPWRCYRRLTIKDPGWRYTEAAPNTFRDVPSLRWLQMVSHRYSTIVDILHALETAGHPFPPTRSMIKNSTTLETSDMVRTIMRIWFMLDLPRNLSRIGVAHNTSYWTDRDIFLAIMFFFKLDMRFTDPIEGQGEIQLRLLLSGQRSLIPLRRLLMGEMTKLDILQMQIQFGYTPHPEHRNYSIFGIMPTAVGKQYREGWGSMAQWTRRLVGVDEIILRESIRRNLGLHMRFLDYLRWGHSVVDKNTAATTISLMKKEPRMKHSWPIEEWLGKSFVANPLLWVAIEEDIAMSDYGSLGPTDEGIESDVTDDVDYTDGASDNDENTDSVEMEVDED